MVFNVPSSWNHSMFLWFHYWSCIITPYLFVCQMQDTAETYFLSPSSSFHLELIISSQITFSMVFLDFFPNLHSWKLNRNRISLVRNASAPFFFFFFVLDVETGSSWSLLTLKSAGLKSAYIVFAFRQELVF